MSRLTEDIMRLYDELPTFWSNKFRSAEAICETLDDLLPNCSYAHHFDQFGSESVEQAAWGDYTKVTYLHAKGERMPNITRRARN
jgi:hypothetical protein